MSYRARGQVPGGRRRPERGRGRPGLTLLDMVITMLIGAILAAVAVPKFAAALHAHRLETSVQRLIADLKYAETLARTRSSEVRMVFGTTAASNVSYYAFDQIPDPDRAARTYRVTLSDEPYCVRLRQAPAELTFSIEGVPNATATFVLELADSARKVVIESGTGQIHES